MIIKLACWAYSTLLTVLLLTPNPAAVVGLKKIPWFPLGDIGMHFCAFFLLAILVHSTRWPKPLHWLWIVALLGYGATTESLQAFVPFRSVELKDYLDNCLGVLAGSGIYWAVHRLWHTFKQKKSNSPMTDATNFPSHDKTPASPSNSSG
jgi:VanZ family protein